MPVPAFGDLLSFVRREGNGACLVALNPGEGPNVPVMPDDWYGARLIPSTHMYRENEPAAGELALRADEGLMLKKEKR